MLRTSIQDEKALKKIMNFSGIKQVGEVQVLEIYLYGEIMADYCDFWTGEIVKSKTSAEYVRKMIEEAETFDEINVYINSCGGSVSEGNAIYNILKRQNKPVAVYVDAFAYSVASVIAMAGDKVIMPSNTVMMIHNAVMGAYGNAADLRKAADDLEKMNEASCNTYLLKTAGKIDKTELKEMLDAETFMTAEEAFKLGFCDEVSNPVTTGAAVEVAKQAEQMKNPYAKQAYEQIKTISAPTKNFNLDKGNVEDSFSKDIKKVFTKIFT